MSQTRLNNEKTSILWEVRQIFLRVLENTVSVASS